MFEIKKATRTKAKLVIGLVGESGSGKTLSAILVGIGMARTAGGNGRLCVIDTENGRAALYAEDEQVKAASGFDTIQLDPPFHPERFADAIASAEAADYPVILIDSISHEWASTGGVLELAESSTVKNDFAKWQGPKKRHNAFFSQLLQSKAHIILAFRAKEKYVQAKENGKTVIVSQGIQPIQNSEMIYDMTVSFLMHDGGLPQPIKVPSMLAPMFSANQKLSIRHGEALVNWVKGGEARNERYDALRIACMAAAEKGMESLKAWFLSLEKADQLLIAAYKDSCKTTAQAADMPNQDEVDEGERVASASETGAALAEVGIGRPKNPEPVKAEDDWMNPNGEMPL